MGQKASMKAANGLGAGWPKADLRLAQSELGRGAGRVRSTACCSTLGRDGWSAGRRRRRGWKALEPRFEGPDSWEKGSGTRRQSTKDKINSAAAISTPGG